jgi:3'(2'), 5'-bisphosphate nucleotidase
VPTANRPDHAALVPAMTTVAVRAALAIRDAAGSDVRRKDDGTPVTGADLAAEAAIRAGLAALAPALPIVSEEQEEGRQPIGGGASYFLVDPLDGTREFIAGRDEYAVNIALMSGAAPLIGIIAAPALGLVWRGMVGSGAERLAFDGNGALSSATRIQARPRPERGAIVVVSRSHLDPQTQRYLETLPQARPLACGSALKFCRVAEGSADLYPRLAPTHDWDVAAGHALIAAAGGQVRAADGTALRYGTAALLIPGFIACGAPGRS